MFTSFKSPKDFYSLTNKMLQSIINEQIQQRMDLAVLIRLAQRKAGYYTDQRKTTLDEYETSPQTERDEQ